MKLKGKSGISLRIILFAGLVGFSVLTALRFYQTFALIDGSTGFFTSNNITVILMYALLALCIIGVICLCYVCGDLPTGKSAEKVSFVSAAAGFLFSIVLMYDGLKDLFSANVFGRGEFSVALLKDALGGSIGFMSVIFAILGSIVILIETLFVAGGKKIPAFLKLPMLLPVLWAFTKTLGFFSVTVSYIKVSQLFFAIFSAAFLMVFLFENARMASDIGRKNAVWFFFASGIIAAGLSFSASLPYLAAAIIAPEKIVSYCPFEIYNIAGGIYCIAAMIRRFGVSTSEDEAPSENIVTETL